MAKGSTSTLTTMGDRERVRATDSSAPFLFLGLECHRAGAMGARYALRRIDSIAIGRAEQRSADVTQEGRLSVLRIGVPDPRMSSEHARLERALGRWLVMDAGSKNGTYRNGERIERAELSDGDVLEAGHTLFVYREALTTAPHIDAICDGSAAARAETGMATLIPGLQLELERLKQIAESDVSVVVNGESGCGKELIARAVHRLSGRRGAFIAVNCGALPESLVEAELFGHKKGAFSGAASDRAGHVRTADQGTLLLDEIGDLPAPSQAAMLRVLQEGEVVPVGSSTPVPVNVRVVAATHRNLDDLVESGDFRGDLLARLSGFRFELPPLRERKEDLGLLIGLLLRKLAGNRADDVAISVPAARALFAHDWPSNIRELEKCLSAAIALAGSDRLDLEHLPKSLTEAPAPRAAELSTEDAQLREKLVAALAEHKGNISAVAREMGKARQQIQRWVKRFDLDPGSYR